MEKRELKISKNKDGHGTINFRISLPSKWIKEMNLDKEEYATLIYNQKNIIIKNKEEANMDGIKIEKALVQYTDEKNYDYTIESSILDFATDKEARDYILNHIEKNYEYYFYESQEDLNNNNHYDVLICNDMKKTLTVKNYTTYATVIILNEVKSQEQTITIDFNELKFETDYDLESYIEEKITQKIHCSINEIDTDSLNNVITSISSNQNHRII